MTTNTEKSRGRRSRRKEEGSERINVELRGSAATKWRDLKTKYGGASAALNFLVLHSNKKKLTREEALAVLGAGLK